MNQKTDYPGQAEAVISVETFDAWQEDHVFSQHYQKRKRRMLRSYRRELGREGKSRRIRFPAAAAAFVLAASGMAALAAESDFFYRIWGTHGKKNIESHEEILYDERKGTSTVVTWPRREYTDENLDRARELIGEAVSFQPVVKQIGDTTLTILAAVSDGNAAVVEFMLEREEGVDALQLHYSQMDNESKGAWFTEDSPFTLDFAQGSGSIQVDLERSSEEVLYCCEYMVIDPSARTEDGLTLEIYLNDRRQEGADTELAQVEAETLRIPVPSRAEQKEFVNAQGGSLFVSPISIRIRMDEVPGLTQEEAGDPWYGYYVALHYRDKTGYLVHEHELGGIHSCEVETDNNCYALEDLEKGLTFVFNRLVDVAQVEAVTVNGTRYVER